MTLLIKIEQDCKADFDDREDEEVKQEISEEDFEMELDICQVPT